MSAENHAARRRRIAEIALKVIAKEGIETATVRRIAAEVGYSTAVVTYYFKNKQDLLASVLRLLGEMNRVKFEEFANLEPPDLVGYLLSMTAISPEDRQSWRVCVAFWERSLEATELADELRSWISEVIGRIEFFITAHDPACSDASSIAAQLFDLVQGISTHMLFDSDRWPPEPLRDTLARTVRLLLSKDSEDL